MSIELRRRDVSIATLARWEGERGRYNILHMAGAMIMIMIVNTNVPGITRAAGMPWGVRVRPPLVVTILRMCPRVQTGGRRCSLV